MDRPFSLWGVVRRVVSGVSMEGRVAAAQVMANPEMMCSGRALRGALRRTLPLWRSERDQMSW